MSQWAPRVDWTPGLRGRWVLPPAFALVDLFFGICLVLGSAGVLPASDGTIGIVLLGFTVGLAGWTACFVARQSRPFNRRIAFSSEGLVLDSGLRTWTFPWSDLAWAHPTRLTAVGGKWRRWGLRINLTAAQAHRARSHLPFPMSEPVEPTLPIQVYDPR